MRGKGEQYETTSGIEKMEMKKKGKKIIKWNMKLVIIYNGPRYKLIVYKNLKITEENDDITKLINNYI